MYPIAWNVARVFGKNPWRPLVTAIVLGVLSACWRGPSAPAAPRPHEERISETRSLPSPAGAAAGPLVDGRVVASVEIPHYPGSPFGWRLELGCAPDTMIDYVEQLRLPIPGDWGLDPELTISNGGRVATVRSQLPCTDGAIEKGWTVSDGDPAGTWTIKVTAAGFTTQTFRLRFVTALP